MARNQKEDHQRRRLRDVYDRNRRRVQQVANARDRNRRSDDESAPRRVIVTERRTRQAGFGRGGVQTRQVVRRRNEGKQSRFEDRSLHRRGNRFERDDDRDRERRRFRRGGGGRKEEGDNNNNGRRLGFRRNNDRRRGGRNGGDRNLDDELDSYKNGGGANKNQNSNDNNRRGGRGGRRDSNKGERNNNNKRGPVTHQDLDAQLESFKASIAQTQAVASVPTI